MVVQDPTMVQDLGTEKCGCVSNVRSLLQILHQPKGIKSFVPLELYLVASLPGLTQGKCRELQTSLPEIWGNSTPMGSQFRVCRNGIGLLSSVPGVPPGG